MNTLCVAVIGHVDHGKTTLVHALTGMQTDTLPEEKARGLTITPGFAHCRLDSGVVDFIDAPGHEDFVQAMITGTSGADAVLIVISARKGIAAQTLERLEIAALLGIEHAVVAVSHVDAVPGSQLAKMKTQIEGALASTPFLAASIVPCSAVTNAGIDALRLELEKLLTKQTSRTGPLDPTLPVDRVFSVPGQGTIVTGTLLGGSLQPDDVLCIQPKGLSAKVRGLQSRGAERWQVEPGERVAVNLRGVSVGDVQRGDVLCAGERYAPSFCMDIHVQVSPNASRSVKHMTKVRVSCGARHAVAQLRTYGGKVLNPGQNGFAQLRFQAPFFAFAGQRAVLRSLSPAQTIGGACFLDPNALPTRAGDTRRHAVLRAALQGDVQLIARALGAASAGAAATEDLARLARLETAQVHAVLGATFLDLGDGFVGKEDAIEQAKAKMLADLAAAHTDAPRRAMVSRAHLGRGANNGAFSRYVINALVSEGRMRQRGDALALSGHDPVALLTVQEKERLTQISDMVRAEDLAAPTLQDIAVDDVAGDLLGLLLEDRQVISLRNVSLKQDLVFHVEALRGAAAALRNGLPNPQNFTTSQARACLATTRRVIVPMLEYFDRICLTARDGDKRRFLTTQEVPPHAEHR